MKLRKCCWCQTTKTWNKICSYCLAGKIRKLKYWCAECGTKLERDVCSQCFNRDGLWSNKEDITETLFLFNNEEYVTFQMWWDTVKPHLKNKKSVQRMWAMVIATFKARGFQLSHAIFGGREWRWVISKFPEDWEA